MARKKKYTRRHYRSRIALTCAGCRAPISAGEPFVRGLTKEPWHTLCRRMRVSPERTLQSRYRQDDPTGKPCLGCGVEIATEDRVVFVTTTPWHTECRKEFGPLAVAIAQEEITRNA